jgi:hypothetical protein
MDFKSLISKMDSLSEVTSNKVDDAAKKVASQYADGRKTLNEDARLSVNEGTKETKTGKIHKAEPGGYGRKNDDDEDGKKVKPAVKKGRGRPKKDSDSDTGEVKKWDTDELARWIVGSKPKTLPGKASVKHKLKDESSTKNQGVAEGSLNEGYIVKNGSKYLRGHPAGGGQMTWVTDKAKATVFKSKGEISKSANMRGWSIIPAPQGVAEGTKETKTGKIHKAEPGGYGRKNDDDEDGKKVKPAVKKGRGRPKKDSDSDTGEVKKWDTDELSRWIVGSKPKTLPGKASVKHKLKDWMEHVEATMLAEATQLPPGTMVVPPKAGQPQPRPGQPISALSTTDATLQKTIQQGIESGKITAVPGATLPAQTSTAQSGQQTKPAQGAVQAMTQGQQQQSQPMSEEEVDEVSMSAAHKAKEARLKSKYDKSEMKASMIDQYGPEKGEDVYFSTIRKQAMGESKKSISEGYSLEEIKQRFPHEIKMCEEGWVLDEGLYEALRHYYFENGFIPNKIMYGDKEECREHVLDCYMKDSKPLLGEEDLDETFIGGALGAGPTSSMTDEGLGADIEDAAEGSIDRNLGSRVDDMFATEDEMSDDAEFPFPNEAMYESEQGVAEGNILSDAGVSVERAIEALKKAGAEKVFRSEANPYIIGFSFSGRIGLPRILPVRKDGKVSLARLNQTVRQLKGVPSPEELEKSINAKQGVAEGDKYPNRKSKWPGERHPDREGPFPGERYPDKDHKKKDVAEGKNKKEKLEMKKVKDAQMEAWDRQLHALLNEGMTVTTSTGQNGMGDSVSVSATDEDAQALMKILSQAGIGMGAGMGGGAGMSHADDTSGTAIEVEPLAHDEIMGTLEPQDGDNGDQEFDFLKRMLGSREEPEASEEPDHADHEEEDDDVKEGNKFTGELEKHRADGVQPGETMKVDGKEYPVKSGKEDSSDDDEEEDEDEDEDSDESEDKEKTDESTESCNECGQGVYEGKCGCDEQLNEWANSRGELSKDEQFQTELNYMTHLISGGLNRQNRDQTTLPHTKVKAEIVKENLSENISKTMKKLAGIK